MNFIEEYPILFRAIVAFIVLAVLYLKSDEIIKILRVKMTKRQFIILIFGIYLILDIVLSWI